MVREGWQAAASRSTLARPSSAQTLGLRGPQYTRVVRTNERTTAALTDLLADDLRVGMYATERPREMDMTRRQKQALGPALRTSREDLDLQALIARAAPLPSVVDDAIESWAQGRDDPPPPNAAEPWADLEARERLLRHMLHKGPSLTARLRRVDKLNTGWVSRRDFFDAVRRLHYLKARAQMDGAHRAPCLQPCAVRTHWKDPGNTNGVGDG